MTPGVHGAFNIGSRTRITINALARMMQDAAGRQVGIQYAPPRKGDVRDSLADIGAAKARSSLRPGWAWQRDLPHT